MYTLVLVLCSLFVTIHCEDVISSTPRAPVSGNLGGTKEQRVALFEEFLNSGKPEQIAAYRDDNPILKEILKAFNKTVQTRVNGFIVHKSMLSSDNMDCDREAKTKADAIMKKTFDETCECLIVFRNRVRAEVTNITDIIEVPDKLRSSLILPVDECFENQKFETFKKFGENTADHHGPTIVPGAVTQVFSND